MRGFILVSYYALHTKRIHILLLGYMWLGTTCLSLQNNPESSSVIYIDFTLMFCLFVCLYSAISETEYLPSPLKFKGKEAAYKHDAVFIVSTLDDQLPFSPACLWETVPSCVPYISDCWGR